MNIEVHRSIVLSQICKTNNKAFQAKKVEHPHLVQSTAKISIKLGAFNLLKI